MLNDQRLSPDSGRIERAVVFLHGLGDSAEGIISLADIFKPVMPDTLFTAPDAPDACEFSPFGYQWFSAQDWTPSVVLEGIKKAAPKLNAYLDALMGEYGLTADKIALVGFSQGTMMSLYVAPRRPESFAGVIGYSGALLGGETLREERTANPPILLVHGKQDDVVPFGAMDRAREGLQNANMNVICVPCPGLAHSIDDLGAEQGVRFLRRVFGM